MKINGGNVDVNAGTGTSRGTFLPLVRVRVTENADTPKSIELHLTPVAARRIGLDLLSAAVASWHDTAIRMHAKETGMDGDTLIGKAEALVNIALKSEITHHDAEDAE